MARIDRDKKHFSLVEKLVGSIDDNIFETQADLLVFAALYAFQHGERTPIENRAQVADMQIFANRGYSGVFSLLAIATTKDESIFLDDPETESKRVTIFEEYANAGLSLLDSKLLTVDGITAIQTEFNKLIEEQIDDEEPDYTDIFN